MNVFDNIAYPLKIQKINKNEIEERVNQVLKIVHLEQYKDRFPSELFMDLEGVPMHGPVHHFIVPAALLTAAAKQSGLAAEILEQKLHTASQRAEKVYLSIAATRNG